MEGFKEYEIAEKIFAENDCIGSENCIFFARKDANQQGMKAGLSSTLGIAGAAVAEKIGKSDALEYLYYDALLINQTETGFGFVPLWHKGIALTLNMDKMEAKYRFVLVLQKKQSLIMKRILHVFYKNLIRNKIMKTPVRFNSLEFSLFYLQKTMNMLLLNKDSMNYRSKEHVMETRKDQKERRKQEIIYAALELFVSKGYAATKITDIAKRANMSTGLMFHYFESKEKLYEELIRMGLEGTAYPVEQQCSHAIDFFEKFTQELFEYMKEQPIMAKFFVLMAEAGRSDATPEHIRDMAMRVNVIEQFVPIIEWGQQEGTIKEGSPIVISNAFWCSVQGIAERYATNQHIDLPKAEWIVDIVRRK